MGLEHFGGGLFACRRCCQIRRFATRGVTARLLGTMEWAEEPSTAAPDPSEGAPSADGSLEALLDAAIPDMTKGTLGSEGGGPLDWAKIHLTVSKGGLFDGIGGEDFALDLATTGCASGDLATAGLCRVHQVATLVGVQDVQTTLAPRVIQTGPDTRVVRLGQRFRDVPVFGASVTLVVHGSVVRAITSTAVTSPEPQNAAGEGLAAELESVTDADLAAAAWWSTVEDSDHDPADRAEVLGRVIVADRDDPESGAWLCGQVLSDPFLESTSTWPDTWTALWTLGRIDDSDEVAESIDFAGLMQFPDGDYSPLDAAGQVGVEALPSALMPDASHLCIYWRADGTEDLYGMIVRDPAEETLSVTSVVDTFRSSAYGASLVRGISTRDGIDMVYTLPSGAVSTSRQYGRY